MRVLVTGANGLLGGNLCRALLNDGHDVRAMVREGSDLSTLEGLDVERVFGDVRDSDALKNAAHGCELFFHTAAVFSYWGYDKEGMYETAKRGAENAVEAAKAAGIKRMVLTSTTAVLGSSPTPTPKDENAVPNLDATPDYFRSKALQEQTAFAHGQKIGLDVVAANPSIFIGPYDFKPSASLPTVTGYITAPMLLTFDGGANLAHVEDIARGHILVGEKGTSFERHILAGDNITWPDAHALISELCGLPKPRTKTSRRAAYLASAAMEVQAKITGKPPQGTRELSKQIGQYFWYDAAKAKALGFTARSTREVLVDTLGWLLTSTHLSDKQKGKLKPVDDVLQARTRYER